MAETGHGALAAPFTHNFPDHGRHLLEQLNIQRYYGAFCDATIRIEEYDFKVHQCMLAAVSPKLQTAIYASKQDNNGSHSNIITIKEVSVAGFRTVLDFLYTGTLKLDLIQIHDVLTAAQYLEIRQVEKACLDYQYYKGVSTSPVNGAPAPPPVQATPPPLPPPPPSQQTPPTVNVNLAQNHSSLQGGHSPSLTDGVGYRGGATVPGGGTSASLYHAPSAGLTPPPALLPPNPAPSPLATMAHVTSTQTSGPVTASSLGFDTNYIEDYLKLIESLQGATDPTQVSTSHLLASSSNSSSSTRYPATSSSRDTQQRTLTPMSDVRYTSVCQPQLATSAPKPLGFPSATGQAGTYSAEDMRKTILSVLSQERFDDDDEEDDVSSVTPAQSLGKFSTDSSTELDVTVTNGVAPHASLNGEVDMGPPTLTPEPSCILPSIINIVPQHRRKPPDLTEVMPLANTLTDTHHHHHQAVLAPCQQPLSDSEDQQMSSPDDGSESCHSGVQHSMGECSSDTQVNNISLTDLDAHSPPKTDIRMKINLRDLDAHHHHHHNHHHEDAVPTNDDYQKFAAAAASQDSDSNDGLDAKAGVVEAKSGGAGKKQKRKKKTPVRLSRQQAAALEEGSVLIGKTNKGSNKAQPQEAETLPAAGPGGVRKRGRPKKEQNKPLKKREVSTSGTGAAAGGSERRKIVCDQCGRAFGKQELLNKHKEMHQRALLYACHICGMKYARPAELTRHQRTHSDVTFHCTECSHMFSDPRDFKKHMEHHGVEKPFFCTFPGCTFRSAKPSIVEKHMVIHSGVKMHPCERCGKMFAQPSGLRSHLRSCLQQRSYLCDFCGSSFNHLQSLKSHRMLHTGEKPYFCQDCGARFTDHRNFKRHRRIHDGSFPYPCSQCDKSFRHSNSLKAHLKTHGIVVPTSKLEEERANRLLKVKREGESESQGQISFLEEGQGERKTSIEGQIIQVKGEEGEEGEIVDQGQEESHSGAVPASVC